MPTYRFFGRVDPIDAPLSLEYEPELHRSDAQESPDSHVWLSIRDGRVSVTMEVKETEDLHRELFGVAADLVRIVTDVATLTDGVAYWPTIDEVELPSGERQRLILADRKLASLSDAFADEALETIVDMAIGDVQLARTLGDAAIMLSWLNYTPIAAGRIADSIVRQVSGGKAAKDWENLRTRLNVDRAFLESLTDEATPARHGDRRYVSGSVNRMLAERAWQLVNRFVRYRMGEGEPLDLNEYPLLSGVAPDEQ